MTQPAPSRRRGVMLIMSSPSGAGKTTLSRLLLECDRNIHMSVSVTTRQRRPTELDGRDYFFIDKHKFDRMAREGDLLEHAQVFDQYYGTPREPVEQALAEGRDVLFDIDWQGAQQLERSAKQDMVSIFILPPSIQELERRLRTRAQDSDEVVARRMARAHDEISHWREYDYVIVNEDVKTSLEGIKAVLSAERLRRDRQVYLPGFVESLS